MLRIFDTFYFYLSFMNKMFKCRLIGNMSQSKSNCLIPIPKILKKWKDITKAIYGKEKIKIKCFKKLNGEQIINPQGFLKLSLFIYC